MNTRFNKSSLVIGMIIGVVAVLTIAASLKPSVPVGRFQTAINSNGSVVMTDTTTGEAWTTCFAGVDNLKDPGFKKPKVQE